MRYSYGVRGTRAGTPTPFALEKDSVDCRNATTERPHELFDHTGLNMVMVTKEKPQKACWRKVYYQRDYEYLLQITVPDVLEIVRKIMRPNPHGEGGVSLH